MIARIALPLACALGAALVAALAALWWSITSHAETRAERDAALARIENIKTAQGIGNDVKDLSDTDLGSDLDSRLSDDD